MNETRIAACGTSLWDARISQGTLDRLVRTAQRSPDRPGPIAHLIHSSSSTARPAPVEATAPERRSALVRLIAEELRRWTNSRGGPDDKVR